MIGFAPAKINLGLRVLRKRADGYHDIQSTLVPIPWYDVLEIEPAGQFDIRVYRRQLDIPARDINCVRLFHELDQEFGLLPIRLHLIKNIPFQAGLGGGSSDLATFLDMLDRHANLGLSKERKLKILLRYGMDCAFFAEGQPKLVEGRGDLMADAAVDLAGLSLICAWPEVNVSTAAAYQLVQPNDKAIEGFKEWSLEGEGLANDFQAPLAQMHAPISLLLDRLQELGAVAVSMSGSGSACFGLFEQMPSLQHIWQSLQLPPENVFWFEGDWLREATQKKVFV